MTLINLKNKKTSIQRKLFLYMITLVVIILVFLAIGLFSLGRFSSTKEKTSKDLSFQSNVFKIQVSKYFEDLTMMSSSLSSDLTIIIDNYINDNNINFSDFNNNQVHIENIQNKVFNKLYQELLKTNCSGAFIIFDATINTNIENYKNSKSGLYFQRSTLDASDESLLLFRGIAELGRKNDIMSHRKWHLEFNTNLIPNYNQIISLSKKPIDKSLFLTNVFTLSGTSERIMLFIAPIINSNNNFYGLCGFEISESYFKMHFAQPSQIEHLTCLLSKKTTTNTLINSNTFSAGVLNGYYLPPNEDISFSNFGNNLIKLKGKYSYIGLQDTINICNNDYLLTLIIPKSEYDKMLINNTIQIVIFLILLFCTTIIVCIFFSKKFLTPVLKSFNQIIKQEPKNSTSSNIIEIDDLFTYLAEQDNLQNNLKLKCDEYENELELKNAEINRLAYSRKTEIDPDSYEIFKNGIKSLTNTEKIIFEFYLDGKSAKEILSICGIQESTLKYHNRNILSKLGVSSRKQMLRYATILKQENSQS